MACERYGNAISCGVLLADLITGEIDIIEYTNLVRGNLMALHSGESCTVAGSGQSGVHIFAQRIRRTMLILSQALC